MKRIIFLVLCAFMGISACAAASNGRLTASFEIRDGNFYRNGEVINIHSGELHFSRVPHEYWRDRLRMVRAMGLNAVATYVFWNNHEPAPGVWDFSGDRDLHEFIRTAGEEGLMVILRPGPYGCGEWEYGGFPWWMQNIEGLRVREDNDLYLEHTQKYFDQLYKEVGDLQVTKGGNLVMMQCENEFGSFVAQRPDISLKSHRRYLSKLTDQIARAGFDIPLFTSDGSWLFEGGAVEGALPTANGEDSVEKIHQVVNEYHGGKGPYMVAEFYPGWLDHWGEPFQKVGTEDVAGQMTKYLENGISFNFYMVFGGTNFGFWSGANYDGKHDIQPDITSYDYDAPISEAGHPTEKYYRIREILSAYSKDPLPAVPQTAPVIAVPDIRLEAAADVIKYASLQPATTADHPLTFEKMGQGYGYMLYTRRFDEAAEGVLNIPGLRDYAVIYVDGQRQGILSRQCNTYMMPVSIPAGGVLQIFVENLGRINYGARIQDNNKGIIGDVKIDAVPIVGGWEMRGLPLDRQPEITAMPEPVRGITDGVARFYSGTFRLKKVGDTFLDMKDFGKGIVFVNGHNLGRYWNIGPQLTLYLPGCWLRKGDNSIVIMDQLGDRDITTVSGVTEPVLDIYREDSLNEVNGVHLGVSK